MEENYQYQPPVEPTAPVAPVYTQPAAPVYTQPATPVYTQPAAPVYAPPAPSAPTVEQVVHGLADQAFGKALASVIMSAFPVASIIAIVMGSKALELVNQARDIATPYGMFGGGKYMAASIMAMVGKYTGIAMTVFWGLYIFLFAMIFALAGI